MPINSRLGKKMDLEVERLGIFGEGVSSWYGCTIFVDGALPGEKVYASLYEKKKNYGRAKSLKILSTSPDRVEPACPLFGTCGGCQIMHLAYAKQLEMKRQKVTDALERIGKCTDVVVNECLPSPQSLHYRNKIQIPVVPKGDRVDLGLYARNSHQLVPMTECFIHCDLGEKVFKHVQSILQNSLIQAFDYEKKTGELRHILIKTAVATNQVLVVLVSAIQPSETIIHLSKMIMDSVSEVKGVVHNFNPNPDNTVLGSQYFCLCGNESIEDELCGLKIKVSPASFCQVNPAQAKVLYETALENANVSASDTVLDAYCGVGAMSLLFARRAKKVIGVEYVAEAIEDAKENAYKNGIQNISFFASTTEDFLKDFKESLDIVVLNPPRKGCEHSVLSAVADKAKKSIVYISCDPATLARDIHILSSLGWILDYVQPFDMFPQTAHVETLVVLKKTII